MKENIVILRQENEQIDYINMNFNILQMGEIIFIPEQKEAAKSY